ncbi:MAG: tRNA pseudouridine(38-40) synthase TruA [Candidatus Thorarchaeota archaeon]|jgi:tRNA pseudouridine38-40 synthase
MIKDSTSMFLYAVRVFYLGTNYHGSQWQPNVPTVQGELINAITEWSGKTHSTNSVQLSGRTDRSVHSIGQIATINTDTQLNIDKINRFLPEDIILWAYRRMTSEFNPRFDVLMRHYRYYLDSIHSNLNLRLMQHALQPLIGTHDFNLLSKPDANRNTTCTILNAYIAERDGRLVLDLFGTSFLWKLVRKIVSLLIRVGNGEFTPAIIDDILAMKTISSGIEPAPPESLVLIESVVPFRMTRSKYGLKRVRKQIREQMKHFKRSLDTLNALNDDLPFD